MATGLAPLLEGGGHFFDEVGVLGSQIVFLGRVFFEVEQFQFWEREFLFFFPTATAVNFVAVADERHLAGGLKANGLSALFHFAFKERHQTNAVERAFVSLFGPDYLKDGWKIIAGDGGDVGVARLNFCGPFDEAGHADAAFEQ